ncbi:barstar family protein [Dermatophilaceae bacterium Sec6.4]|nr:barstar family protein [Actinomycetota bacterium]
MSESPRAAALRELVGDLERRRPGVRELPLDVADAAAAGSGAGWHVVQLDTSGDRDDLFAQCSRAFELPGWFGRNWDALADALSDVQHRPGTLVIWSGERDVSDAVRSMATEIFEERADNGPAPLLVVVVRPAAR